jgi:hypothetical protein
MRRSLQTDGQALPGCGHAERALQASWWQEHGAAHAGEPRAQQAGKLETRALFPGSQGGTVARAGGNTCAPRSVQVDLTLRSRLPTLAKSSVASGRLSCAALRTFVRFQSQESSRQQVVRLKLWTLFG